MEYFLKSGRQEEHYLELQVQSVKKFEEETINMTKAFMYDIFEKSITFFNDLFC